MKKKWNIFLDLDQTLISAEPLEKDDNEFLDINNREIKKKIKKYKWHNMDGYYAVFERPYLQEFLDFIFENFNVSIWTAATKSYALFIIRNIILVKPNRKLDYIFFKQHCKYSYKFNKKTKNLRVLKELYKINKFNLSNSFIIDDYDEVFNTQPSNCIRAPPFFLKDKDSHKDDFLKKLKDLFDRSLKNKNFDVNNININFSDFFNK